MFIEYKMYIHPGQSGCNQDHPPRMRGKALYRLQRGNFFGITPAYAGKSLPCYHFILLCRDHPRVCGEKKRGESVTTTSTGSPPRMRGKGSPRLRVAWDSQDHPRVCGEKFLCFFISLFEIGSPPRMRGKVILYNY